MRIAQVSVGRFPSPVHVGGGDVRRWQDLCSLSALDHDVHIIVCDPSNASSPELERRASWVTVHHSHRLRTGSPRWLMSRVFNPTTLALAHPDLKGLRGSVQKTLHELDPSLVWPEEARAVLLSSGVAPTVHSHLDFLYKLRSVRRLSFARGERL